MTEGRTIVQTRGCGPAAQVSARRLGILDATSAATIPASGIIDTRPRRMKLSGICGTIDLPGLTNEPTNGIDGRSGNPYSRRPKVCAPLEPVQGGSIARDDRRVGQPTRRSVRIRDTGFRDRTAGENFRLKSDACNAMSRMSLRRFDDTGTGVAFIQVEQLSDRATTARPIVASAGGSECGTTHSGQGWRR